MPPQQGSSSPFGRLRTRRLVLALRGGGINAPDDAPGPTPFDHKFGGQGIAPAYYMNSHLPRTESPLSGYRAKVPPVNSACRPFSSCCWLHCNSLTFCPPLLSVGPADAEHQEEEECRPRRGWVEQQNVDDDGWWDSIGGQGGGGSGSKPVSRGLVLLDLDKCSIFGNDGNDLGIAMQWMECTYESVRELYRLLIRSQNPATMPQK